MPVRRGPPARRPSPFLRLREQVPAGALVRLVPLVLAVPADRDGGAARNETAAREVERAQRGGGRPLVPEVAHQADPDRPAVVPEHVGADPVDGAAGVDPARRGDHEVVADRQEPAVDVPALDLAHVARLRLAGTDPARRIALWWT